MGFVYNYSCLDSINILGNIGMGVDHGCMVKRARYRDIDVYHLWLYRPTSLAETIINTAPVTVAEKYKHPLRWRISLLRCTFLSHAGGFLSLYAAHFSPTQADFSPTYGGILSYTLYLHRGEI